MQTLFGAFIFIFGLIIGSFLNVVIFRLEKEEGLGGRSYCPHCRHQLSWMDLIPLISFLWLMGKCRYCKSKISIQYPLVELSTGVLFFLISHYYFFTTNALEIVFLWYICSVFIIIFVYDLRHYLIPDKILFPAILITFLYRLSVYGMGIGEYLVASLIAFGFFLFIFLISKGNWMGFGDVKLAILLGLLLGFPNIVAGLFLAFLFGAVIGVGVLLLRVKGLKSEMPFAPFLIVGTATALFFGQQLIEWYLGLLLL